MTPIQIILSIATIAMSGLVSGLVAYQLNSRRDSRQLRREKLEAVYGSFSGFVAQLESRWTPYPGVMANKNEYNAALAMTIKKDAAEPEHLHTLEMQIAIYFPRLQPHLDELIEIRKIANEIVREHKEECKVRGPHGSSSLIAMQAVSKKLTVLNERFRDAIRAEAHRLNKKIPGVDHKSSSPSRTQQTA